jgi:hypothetical protein
VKINEIAILPPMPLCIVSFVDLDGLRHSVEVQRTGFMKPQFWGLLPSRSTIASPE